MSGETIELHLQICQLSPIADRLSNENLPRIHLFRSDHLNEVIAFADLQADLSQRTVVQGLAENLLAEQGVKDDIAVNG